MAIEVTMLHTPGCKSCAKARTVIQRVADDYDITFEAVDLTENPEIAAEYRVMSAPGIVMDGELVFQGGVSEAELRAALDERTGEA